MTESLGLIIAGIGGLAALLFGTLWKSEESKSKKLLAGQNDQKEKLESAKQELQKTKSSLTERTRQLEELRDNQRKKDKRAGKKQQLREQTVAKIESGVEVPELVERRLEAAVAAVEAQMKQQAKDADAKLKDQAQEFKDASADLRSTNKTLQKDLELLKKDLKAAKEFRPDIPGSEIELDTLPQDALRELAFHYTKGEEFRKLYRVSRGQQRLLQDQLKELRVKYLSVCRELALVVGGQEANTSDEKQVEAAADAILEASKNNTTVFAEHQIAAAESSEQATS